MADNSTAASAAESPQPLATVEATITGVRNAKGNVLVCMTANAKAYPDCGKDPKSRKLSLPARATMTAKFEDVGPGTYAIALIHDENGNNKMDTRLFLPKEGFGMSRNPAIRMGPPTFKSAAFAVGSEAVKLPITMRYML
jgi:uncharacterized protein (DUF2141 family)